MYRDTLTAVTEDLINQVAKVFSRIPPDVIRIAQENIGELYRGIQRVLTNLGQSLIVAFRIVTGLVCHAFDQSFGWPTSSPKIGRG